MKKSLIGAALALGAACSAHAADAAPQVRFLAGLGIAGGGDTLVTVPFTDGSRQDVTAGGGGILYVGGEYRGSDVFSVEATIGIHFRTTQAATNGSVTFYRYPLDVLAHYHLNDKVRVGAGAQFALGPKLDGSGVASNIDQSYKTAVGAIVEGEYLFTPHTGLKLRYVSEKFKPNNSNQSVSGNHVGLLFSYYY